MSGGLADIVLRFVQHEEHPPKRTWAESFATIGQERACMKQWDRWEAERRELFGQMRDAARAAVKGGS